jgi:hypothetical protein
VFSDFFHISSRKLGSIVRQITNKSDTLVQNSSLTLILPFHAA